MSALTPLGLGTFSFANVFTHVSETEARNIVNTLLEQGGKYIQSAPYYSNVYKVLRPILLSLRRDAYFFATSVVKNKEGEVEWNYDAIIRQCNESLKDLGLDYIDLLMTSDANTDDPAGTPFEETISALAELKKQGKVRHIGVANVSLTELKSYNIHNNVEFVQNRFSLLNRSVDDNLSSYLLDHNIRLIPYEVLERGMLTNKGMRDFEIGADDFRRRKPEFHPAVMKLVRQWVIEYLYPIAHSLEVSIEALVIWWTLQQSFVGVVVVGATSSEQLRSNFQALAVKADSGVLQSVEEAYKAFESRIDELFPTTIQKFLRVQYRP